MQFLLAIGGLQKGAWKLDLWARWMKVLRAPEYLWDIKIGPMVLRQTELEDVRGRREQNRHYQNLHQAISNECLSGVSRAYWRYQLRFWPCSSISRANNLETHPSGMNHETRMYKLCMSC